MNEIITSAMQELLKQVPNPLWAILVILKILCFIPSPWWLIALVSFGPGAIPVLISAIGKAMAFHISNRAR